MFNIVNILLTYIIKINKINVLLLTNLFAKK